MEHRGAEGRPKAEKIMPGFAYLGSNCSPTKCLSSGVFFTNGLSDKLLVYNYSLRSQAESSGDLVFLDSFWLSSVLEFVVFGDITGCVALNLSNQPENTQYCLDVFRHLQIYPR